MRIAFGKSSSVEAREASAKRKKPSVSCHSFVCYPYLSMKSCWILTIRILGHFWNKKSVYLKVVFMRTPRICLLKLVARLSSPLPFWFICPSKNSHELSLKKYSRALFILCNNCTAHCSTNLLHKNATAKCLVVSCQSTPRPMNGQTPFLTLALVIWSKGQTGIG